MNRTDSAAGKSPNPGFSDVTTDSSAKELGDIAQAAVLLESGRLNEGQLASATRGWSVRDDRTLAEQLTRCGLLTADEGRELETQADDYLRRDGQSADPGATAAWDGGSPDRFARIAKLLGIGNAPAPETHKETREVTTHFTLIRKLGQGGIGSVWLARDENLRRKVAIKELISRPQTSDAALRRFQREAEITGQLEHPNIVSVYQFGKDGDTGRAFFAMRFVGKKTLDDAIIEYHEKRESGMEVTMDLHRLLSAFLTVCQAVGYAHSCGVIHRDLKPENVALDNFGQVIVIDWGLAKTLEDGDQHDFFAEANRDEGGVDQTVAGQVLGTPLYMAPEQAAGRLSEIDERTDIFGLGAILFAILTGYAPHEKSHSSLSTNTKVSELFASIANAPTPRVSDHLPGVDPALASICDKAMSKRRYARYDNAGLLAEDVQRWMAGEPITAYKEPVSARVNRWITQNRRWSQLIAIALITLIVSGITLGIMARQNAVTESRNRFNEMLAQSRQLEIQLQSATRNLAKETRFMANVPPIQGIIQSRDGIPEADSEAVWRTRLEKIYLGLLRANTEDISVTYISVDANTNAKEIVRVARQATELDQIVVVPKSRLADFEPKGLVQDVTQLQPGEVKCVSVPLERKGPSSVSRRGMTMTACVPVYNESTGALFGAVAIEADLGDILRTLAANLKKGRWEILITDASGKITMRQRTDARLELDTDGINISSIIPKIEGFFDAAGVGTHSDEHSYVARRVRLDPDNPASVVGIVMRLTEK